MTETPLTLILEIDAHGDHVSGRVCGPAGAGRDFVGRIGLMCAIDALVAADAAAASPTIAIQEEPE
jgi:hypothetical protein